MLCGLTGTQTCEWLAADMDNWVCRSTGLEPGRIIGFGGSGTGGFGPEVGDVGTGSQSPATAAAGAGDDDAKHKPKAPALLDVDRRVFGRILLSPDSLSDHLPDTYLTYLRQL